MKISSTSIRSRIPWRFEAETAGELNLLDLRPADHRPGGGGRWTLFTLLIVVHGGLLGYLIGFARMPREAHSYAPKAISVELTVHPARAKQDREAMRAAPGERTRASKVAALRPRHARPSEQQPVAAIGLSLPERPIGTLPEDRGLEHLQEKHVPLKTVMEPVFHPKLQENQELALHSDSIGMERAPARAGPVRPAAQQPASAEPLPEPGNAHEATARLASAEQAPEGLALPDSVGQSLRLLASQGGAFMPEDTGRIDPLADKAGGGAPAPDTPGETPSANGMPDAPDQKTARMVPLPDRRRMVAGAIASHEQSSSDAAGPDGRGELASTYRAKVRAHLAAHKPTGGFGAGTVVVAFTLTRSGDVASARILRSRGIDHLDQGALNAVHRAAPFPKPPRQVKGARFHFAIPFRFQ
jgi:TonB family protein